MDYSQWFDEWGSWDPYSTIMSEIDGDLDDLLTIFHLLFGENRRLKEIKFRHIRVDREQHVSMLEYTNEFEKRFRMSRSMLGRLLRPPFRFDRDITMNSAVHRHRQEPRDGTT
jgi:hypothetical protein